MTPTAHGCVVSLIILLVACIVLPYAYFYIGEKIIRQPISQKLGIDTWKELDRYIDKTFVEGMPRKKVYKELEKFGNYEITPTTWGNEGEICELIGLPTGYSVNYSNVQYLACFSKEDDSLIFWTLND